MWINNITWAITICVLNLLTYNCLIIDLYNCNIRDTAYLNPIKCANGFTGFVFNVLSERHFWKYHSIYLFILWNQTKFDVRGSHSCLPVVYPLYFNLYQSVTSKTPMPLWLLIMFCSFAFTDFAAAYAIRNI